MHLPGYIQEGREADYGYLLLGVYYRNSPSCTNAVVGSPLRNAPGVLYVGFNAKRNCRVSGI
jgi:hypothetical protein